MGDPYVLSCVKLVVYDLHVSLKAEEIGGVETLEDDEDDAGVGL
jgi:hypothetical protein